MKSLEKLIEIEKYYQNIIIDLYLKTQISKWEKDAIYDKYKDDFEQIKQDLEVLEIIRNKLVDFTALGELLLGFSLEVALSMYNYNHFEITMEELLKLKQWLEENENE